MYLPVGILREPWLLTHPTTLEATSAERILSTALDLFAVKGYDATAVREICEAAGITKPTLYHFYGSKDGVFQALVQSGFLQYRGMVDAALAMPGSLPAPAEGAGAVGVRKRKHAAAFLALHARRHLGAAGHRVAANRAVQRSSTTV